MASDLLSLVKLLQENATGVSNEEAFEYLHSLVAPDIKVRYEVVSKAESSARETRFSHLNGAKIGRIQLTADRNRADFRKELNRVCNGVVLEFGTWKILSIPPPMFNPRFRVTELSKNINKYEVYEIKDGTTVTLYYYNNKWCFNSTNGFDVSDFRWTGTSTYASAFDEVSKLYPDFSLDKLQKDHCYTIGFRHHDFHPLKVDPQKLWLVRSYDINNKEQVTDENIGLPAQTLAKFPVKAYKNLVNFMMELNNASFNSYMNSVKSDGEPKPDVQPAIHYGYILRCSSAGAHSNILLESELLKRIRLFVYNLPKHKSEYTPVTPETRVEYTVLKAFLDYQNKSTFFTLFPQFTPNYHKYTNIFNKITNKVMLALKSKNARDTLILNQISPVDKLSAKLVKKIEEHGRISVLDSQGPSIINDFIMDKKYLDLYFSMLVAQ